MNTFFYKFFLKIRVLKTSKAVSQKLLEEFEQEQIEKENEIKKLEKQKKNLKQVTDK